MALEIQAFLIACGIVAVTAIVGLIVYQMAGFLYHRCKPMPESFWQQAIRESDEFAKNIKDAQHHWLTGNRAAWVRILNLALHELGFEDRKLEDMILEREEAIAQLRMACDEYGDNDWPNGLHLADIIEKHLVRYLESDSETENEEGDVPI